MLNAKIAVVDVTAAIGGLLERKCIDDIGHDLIAEPNVSEQRYALAVEKPAVIGRQADGGVALIDGPAKIVDDRPVLGGACGEDIITVFALPDIAAHLLA